MRSFLSLLLLAALALATHGAGAAVVPTAAFDYGPAAPLAGSAVGFTDASTGAPKAWRWSFGDGATSTLASPRHVYAGAGSYTVILTVKNAAGTSSASRVVAVAEPSRTTAFAGSVVLGAPTADAVRLTVLSPNQAGLAFVRYGTVAGGGPDDRVTPTQPLAAGVPLVLRLDGLAPQTRHYYRLHFQASGETSFGASPEATFHTARAPGSTFTFTLQADPHLDENSSLDQYRRTLANVLADRPDFHVDLGDTFMCEKHCSPLSAVLAPGQSQAEVDARYAFEHASFGLAAHSAPLFLVNGNHDGEAGWLADGTDGNLAVWTTRARLRHFSAPVPDGFYGGDATVEPIVGQRASWYAWHWGDALFVVLDPYWNTPVKPADGWALSLGARQYQWLLQTLAQSPARFKFVFVHNLVGGLDGQMRGGVEAAPYYEWGGRNADGSDGFAARRPGWAMPIHALLVRHGVTAVFHGHDHLYTQQALDGIVYQEVPQPSALNNRSGPTLAAAYHYGSGAIDSSSGHLRVTVSPDRVTAEYVRSWLPEKETSTQRNGAVADAWYVDAAPATPAGAAPAPAP